MAMLGTPLHAQDSVQTYLDRIAAIDRDGPRPIIGARWEDAAVLRAGAAHERELSAVLRAPALQAWRAS